MLTNIATFLGFWYLAVIILVPLLCLLLFYCEPIIACWKATLNCVRACWRMFWPFTKVKRTRRKNARKAKKNAKKNRKPGRDYDLGP